jgi:hypothetical protein
LAANSAIAIVPSAFARIIGRPDISPTLKIQPEERLLFMPNNFPDVPSNNSELSERTVRVIGAAVVLPINAIDGLVAPVYPKAA